jgi:prephenate dehydrogenase
MSPVRIAILAPGLIGGSVALAATRTHPKAKIAIWTRHSQSVPAVRQHLPNAEIGTDPSLVRGSDLVILAAPPSALPTLIQSILPHLSPHTLVTDVSSIKLSVESSVAPLLQGQARWIGSHPMAGSEESGIQAARHDLFQKAPVILTPSSSTSADTLQDATSFWKSLGARVLSMSPAQHDSYVALISHLPHCIASTLVLAAGTSPLPLAGSGYRDTTRVAGGPSALWAEILLSNRTEILASLQTFHTSLTQLTSAIEKSDSAGLTHILEKAAHIRRNLHAP